MKPPKPTRTEIEAFIALPAVALVGVSSNPKKFGATAFHELLKRNWRVIPVNPNMSSVDGIPCYSDLSKLPEKVGGVVSMVPAKATLGVAKQCLELGIQKLWIQWKSDSAEALTFCMENGIQVIYGQCILMHYPPVTSFHGFHRWMNSWLTPLKN